MIKNITLQSIADLSQAINSGKVEVLNFEVYEDRDEQETTMQIRFAPPGAGGGATGRMAALIHMMSNRPDIKSYGCGENCECAQDERAEEATDNEEN